MSNSPNGRNYKLVVGPNGNVMLATRVGAAANRERQVLINWAKMYNKTELNKLLGNNTNVYNARIEAVVGLSNKNNTNLRKSIIARYLLYLASNLPEAKSAVRTFHANVKHTGANRISNNRLVNLVAGAKTADLKKYMEIFKILYG